MTTIQEPASYRDIADTAGVAVSLVHGVVHAARPEWSTGQRAAFPPDLATLLATALASRVLDRPAARKLGEDPDAVLRGAQALAELARRIKADQQAAEQAAPAA